MKINCLVKTLFECEKGFDTEIVAHEVDPKETVEEMLDRLVGHNRALYSKITREHDPSILVELRVAKAKPEEEG